MLLTSSVDTFKLNFKGEQDVPMEPEGISWPSDRETKFKNPDPISELNKYALPPNWHKRPKKNFLDEDFMVWMRVASFPTFRKLYRKSKKNDTGPYKNSLPRGRYTLKINYSIFSY